MRSCQAGTSRKEHTQTTNPCTRGSYGIIIGYGTAIARKAALWEERNKIETIKEKFSGGQH